MWLYKSNEWYIVQLYLKWIDFTFFSLPDFSRILPNQVKILLEWAIAITCVFPWKSKNGITSLQMPKIKIRKSAELKCRFYQWPSICNGGSLKIGHWRSLIKSAWSILVLTALFSDFHIRHLGWSYPIFQFLRNNTTYIV